MTSKRLTIVLCLALVVLVMSGAGLTLYANSWLTKKSQNLVTLKLDIAELERVQRINQTAAEYLQRNKESKELLERVIPKSKDQAGAVAELLKIAEESGVTINSITFPASDLGGKRAQSSAKDTVTQAKPVEGISGILGIEMSVGQIDRIGGISGSGMTYQQLISFLEAVEKNRRTMQVRSLQVQPLAGEGTNNIRGYSLTLTMNIFVKP